MNTVAAKPNSASIMYLYSHSEQTRIVRSPGQNLIAHQIREKRQKKYRLSQYPWKHGQPLHILQPHITRIVNFVSHRENIKEHMFYCRVPEGKKVYSFHDFGTCFFIVETGSLEMISSERNKEKILKNYDGFG